MSAAVVFDNVSKKFRRGEHHDSLRDLVPAMVKGIFTSRPAETTTADEFWAVRDVTFEVNEGEALGIIGPNGAGKSTILKLLTKILRPTRGQCAIRGRVGALIEVAAGFHPDLTGRENVFLQGAIVGMKRAEIARKFDQIVDFSGIGEFIDTPVKRFSSGMNARLGFAIAAHLDPEVLIIDEVLSVGDSSFQARCTARMRELQSRGVPLVFVSHNLPAVLELCTKAILLNKGQVVFSGSVSDTLQHYRRTIKTPPRLESSKPGSDIWIKSVQVLDRNLAPAELVPAGSPITIRVGYDTARPVTNPSFAVDVHRADGVYCYGINMAGEHFELGTLSGSGSVDLHIDALQLTGGYYNISVGIHRSGIGSSGGIGMYDLHQLAYPFTITSEKDDMGVVRLGHSWRHQPRDPKRSTASTRKLREVVNS